MISTRKACMVEGCSDKAHLDERSTVLSNLKLTLKSLTLWCLVVTARSCLRNISNKFEVYEEHEKVNTCT